MKRSTNRALSMVLAIVMILSLFTVLPVSAAGTTDPGTYKFAKTDFEPMPGTAGEKAQDGTTDKIAVTDTEMTAITTNNGYFKFTGDALKRANTSSGNIKDTRCNGIELGKSGAGALTFTVTGKAKVTITVGSTGSSNTSSFALVPKGETNDTNKITPDSFTDNGETDVAKQNTDHSVYGTGDGSALVWNELPAGSYDLINTGAERALRVYGAEAVQTAAAPVDPVDPVDPVEPEETIYKITVDANITGGAVTTTPAEGAKMGAEVTVDAKPDGTHELGTITVKTASGKAVTVNGTKFTMPGEAVTVSATFTEKQGGDEPPAPASKTEWVATTLDIVPGTDGTDKNGRPTKTVDKETQIVELDGMTLWIGAGPYKILDAEGDIPVTLAGDANPDPKDGTTPTKGTYFKFVATKTGEFKVDWAVNKDKPIYILDNGVKMEGGTGGTVTTKTLLHTTFIAEKDHTYHVFCTSSKAMLAGFSFVPVEEKIDEWTATTLDVVPGTDGTDKNGRPTKIVDKETKIVDGESVELWIGAGPYKILDAEGDIPVTLAGDANPDPKDGTTPTKGTYFKFVAKTDGELNVDWAVNKDKPIYILDNGVKQEGGTGGTVTTKTLLHTRLMAKKDHIYHVFCTSSKAMLAGFTFKAGGVTEAEAEWTADAILGPSVSITGTDKKDGTLTATVVGPRVGLWINSGTAWTCADYMTIEMYNEAGELLDSVVTTDPGDTHKADFHPSLSGKYTFKAILSRDEQPDIPTEMSARAEFVLPIPKPAVTVGVKDGGVLEVSWPRFVEADGYNLYMADSEGGLASADAIPLDKNQYTTAPLTVGTTYYFKVETLRGTEKSEMSDVASGTASADAKVVWKYTYYGVSTTAWDGEKGNTTDAFDADHYPDGVIGTAEKPFTITSWGGAGKVQEGDQDGVSFVYTRVPGDQNFTLRAKVKVKQWRYEGQEGMGLMATDFLGSGNDLDKKNEVSNVFVNNYMVGCMRFGNGSLGATFGKAFKGNKGVGMIQQVGNPNPTVKPASWDYKQINLDPYPEEKGMTSGTYNILGNEIDVEDVDTGTKQRGTVKAGFTQAVPLVTEFDLEIERNNTGIYGRYYLPNGDVKVAKTYDRDALLQQDPDSMYVGFFAARHMIIEISNVQLKTGGVEDYPEKEVPDTTYITPRINVGSPLVSNSEDYNLILTSNVEGTATVTSGGVTKTVELVKQKADDKSTGATRFITRGDLPVPVKNGINTIQVTFQPAPQEEQGLADYYELLNTDPVKTSVSVTYQNKFAERNNLYVSPKGTYGGLGTKERPLDLYTAVKLAQPGQKVILMEGTYTLSKSVVIEKGISGTQDKPIYLMADPEATERIVLDGSRVGNGITLKGDYWHFYNFVVQGCGGVGISVNGNNNVIEYVDLISNEGTGLQISRAGDVDGVLKYWPSNNLIVNCLSMNNRDSSWGGSDGFASKLTSGAGNVFRYCVAAYNSDDGWDLFAKSEDGPIGDVIIENCVVYKNGFGLDPNGNEITDQNANGNGFKMGGSGVYGNHKVFNSYSFYNKAKGVDSNSGPNTEAHNVVSYNNIGPNIRFYTNKDVANTKYKVDNWISFKSEDFQNVEYVNEGKTYVSYNVKDEIEGKGTQKQKYWQNETAYYWNAGTTASTEGTIADPASLFVSTDIKDLVIGYNDEGNLTLIGDFLKLKDPVPANLQSVVPSNDPANYHDPANLMVMPDKSLSDPYCITPDAEFVIPGNTSSGGGRGDRGDETTTTSGNRVDKRTNGNGDVLITVTDPTGETLVDVTLPATVPAITDKFVDVPEGHWAEAAINEMAGLGMVKGVDDVNHIYDMDSAVTRGTLATLLFRLSHGKTGLTNTFNDVASDAWYTDAVAWASKVGIVNGYGDGTFGPDAAITRQELAVMLARYANLLNVKAPADATMGDFADKDAVADWAKDAVTFATATGIIKGTDLNTINPTASATRAETAVMLQRFIALLK